MAVGSLSPLPVGVSLLGGPLPFPVGVTSSLGLSVGSSGSSGSVLESSSLVSTTSTRLDLDIEGRGGASASGGDWFVWVADTVAGNWNCSQCMLCIYVNTMTNLYNLLLVSDGRRSSWCNSEWGPWQWHNKPARCSNKWTVNFPASSKNEHYNVLTVGTKRKYNLTEHFYVDFMQHSVANVVLHLTLNIHGDIIKHILH